LFQIPALFTASFLLFRNGVLFWHGVVGNHGQSVDLMVEINFTWSPSHGHWLMLGQQPRLVQSLQCLEFTNRHFSLTQVQIFLTMIEKQLWVSTFNFCKNVMMTSPERGSK
jgi:hypothetical protein